MKVPRRCELCGGALLADDWELGFDRLLCVFCEEEYGEEEQEKEEGEDGRN